MYGLVDRPSDRLCVRTIPLYRCMYRRSHYRDYSDAWKLVARQFENGSSNIKGIDFDQSYISLEHSDYFRTIIAISDMHRLTGNILDVSNTLNNKMLSLMKESLSVHHPIIWTGLKILPQFPFQLR